MNGIRISFVHKVFVLLVSSGLMTGYYTRDVFHNVVYVVLMYKW